MAADSYIGPLYYARCRTCETLYEVTKWTAEKYDEQGHVMVVCRTCGTENDRFTADIEYRPDDIERLEAEHGEIDPERL